MPPRKSTSRKTRFSKARKPLPGPVKTTGLDRESEDVDIVGSSKKTMVKPTCKLTDVKETDVFGVEKLNISALINDLEKWAGVKCLHLMKWAEGKHDVIYRCEFRDGSNTIEHIIVRLCKPCLTSKQLESEIATMRYCRDFIPSIPIPSVFHCNLIPQNPIGCEYSVHTVASGLTARTMWQYWTQEEKLTLMDSLANVLHELFTHRVGGFGSLYLVTQGQKTLDKFEIGETIKPQFFNQSFQRSVAPFESVKPRIAAPLRPWNTANAWMVANVRLQLEYLEQYPEHAAISVGWDIAKYPTCLDGYKSVLKGLISLSEIVLCPPELPFSVNSALWRPYLNMDDIMFLPDNAKITSLLDWEMTAVVPLWQAATVPEFMEEGPNRKPAELLSCYRDRFLMRMGELDALMDTTRAEVVKWTDCYLQGKIFRELKEHCDRQWYELDQRTRALMDAWAALVSPAL
ncbi:hypothetical protein DACRYDRAFT_16185 [Dacryopinax primogenitus]|uniref:Altered inheritance of mitochondria protein 9, mitochondrial n=1 Tax=Dacryopinax primogenitus (strain DJM 731) TaxID=1858805 RepID=M5G6Q3_DACPD|nr:uncharacterized protein DACRYDRAFT_16185 [Dacryopinax primogenitus]EJU01502.1 hypothetical protein DACRYDRAFT_16185 [Dacryopinax primogenitus]